MCDNFLSELPFYNITAYELELLYSSFAVKDNICQNTDFYDKIRATYNNSIIKELDFSYCTEDDFNRLYKKCASSLELGVFHVNIRSLNKNHRNLIHFLQSLDITFDVIVLSEIWNYNLEFYCNILKNYNFHYTVCNNSNVGGVGIYVKKTLTCQQLHSISIPSNIDQMVENLWLEISTESFTYIVAGIYRHPNQNTADFTPKLEHCLELVKKKKSTLYYSRRH